MTIRAERLLVSRMGGRHTESEWRALLTATGYLCVRCGHDGRRLTRDHIMPLYAGGTDDITNLQPLCHYCNMQKGAERYDWLAYRQGRNPEPPPVISRYDSVGVQRIVNELDPDTQRYVAEMGRKAATARLRLDYPMTAEVANAVREAAKAKR